MAQLLSLFGPWGVLLLGLLIGLALGGIPFVLRANRLQVDKARLELELIKMREVQAAKDASGDELKLQMQALATDVLQKNSQAFLTMAEQKLQQHSQVSAKDLEKRQEGISALLKPLKETVDLYRQQTQSGQGALKQQITNLTALGQDMSQQAAALRNALTSGPRGAGAWGEQQLKNVMTRAGMAEHVDFDLQVTLNDEDGKAFRPDARVNLAGGGVVFIDSKAPAEAYIRAHENRDAADGTQTAAGAEDFVRALREHVKSLGKKGYWDKSLGSPDFVALFLPADAMLATAFEQDPDIFNRCMEQKVVLTCPSTLIALLTTVAYGWRQESLNTNAKEIAKLGKELYDAMAILGDKFQRLHKNISQTAKSYNEMVGSLGKTFMPKARKFRDLQLDPGIKTLAEPTALEDIELKDPALLTDLQTPLNSDVVDQTNPAQIGSDDETA